MNRHRLFLHPGMQYLYKAVQWENHQKLIGCLILWLAGTIAMFFGLANNFLLSFLGLCLVALSIWLGFPILKKVHNEENKLFYVLRHQPRRIVWIYGVLTEHMPFGISFIRSAVLYIKMIDGEEITVSLRPAKLALVLNTLKRLLPHATYGYSLDIANQYELKPEFLLRDSKQGR